MSYVKHGCLTKRKKKSEGKEEKDQRRMGKKKIEKVEKKDMLPRSVSVVHVFVDMVSARLSHESIPHLFFLSV